MAFPATFAFWQKLSDLPFRSYKALNIPQNGLETSILTSRTLALAKARASVENASRKAIIKEEIKGRVTRSIAQLNNDKNETINRKPIPLVIETKEYQPFMYEDKGKVVIFKQLSHDYIMRCPQCKIETKHIIQHLANNSNCNAIYDINTFKSRFQLLF